MWYVEHDTQGLSKRLRRLNHEHTTQHTSEYTYISQQAEVQSSTTLRIMDRYQEKIRMAPRALLLHSMRELSYHGGAGGTVKCVDGFESCCVWWSIDKAP